ncbi:MAG: hypothetical protein AAF667_09510 [Pseudomonadota bacterium]
MRDDKMDLWEWGNSAANLVIGILLGWAADGLIGLTTTPFWPMAILIPLLFLGVVLFDRGFSALIDRFIMGGVKPSLTPRRKPLLRRLSLPVGLAIGFALSRLGIDLPFLGTV